MGICKLYSPKEDIFPSMGSGLNVLPPIGDFDHN